MPAAPSSRLETTMFIPSLIRAWRMRKAFIDTFHQLSQLDDRALADINVGRGEIYRVSKQAARKAVA
jgi:uncharacterized protein YjiS (DUF1127 family)